MIYRPEKNRSMWDTWVYYYEKTYYLYYLTMGLTEKQGWHGQGVAMATSQDGVHWDEAGVVIPKDEGATGLGSGSVWKSEDFDKSGEFIMNYSTWFDWCIQSQHICFAKSTDLIHWEKLGSGYDFRADPCWYETYPESKEARWDCMYTVSKPGDGRYGYWTARPKGRSGFGFGKSQDGMRWTALEPPLIIGNVPQGEVGAIEKIDSKYYMLYHGGSLILVADNVRGPFRSSKKNREFLKGNAYFTRFFSTPNGLLVNHHSISREGLCNLESPLIRERKDLLTNLCNNLPRTSPMNWAVANGLVYVAPLKRAIVDEEGVLRLAYWEGNDKLKGEKVEVKLAKKQVCNSFPIYMIKNVFDIERGVMLEGTLPLSSGSGKGEDVISGYNLKKKNFNGFFIEYEKNQGSYIIVEPNGLTEIGLTKTDGTCLSREWKIDREINLSKSASFRILLKHSLLEFYLDNILIQVYSLPKRPTGRVGLINNRDSSLVKDWKVWYFSIS